MKKESTYIKRKDVRSYRSKENAVIRSQVKKGFYDVLFPVKKGTEGRQSV